MLDSKLDACNQKMHMLKGDPKGKTIAHESHKVDQLITTPYLASNPSTYFNFMGNMSQAQTYPPLMNISDKTHLGFWPLQLGQSSQPSSMISNAQSYPCKHIDVNWANWANQVNANVTYDSKIDMKRKDGAENDENLSPYYYYGNAMAMQSYPTTMHSLPFHNLSNLSHGFQLKGFNDMSILQPHMFNYMDGRK